MNELHIWVCFKIQPDFEHVLESDWAGFGPGSDISYAKHSFSCFDESALEIALRLKDSLTQEGRDVTLGAITLADSLPPAQRKHLFAAGYDEILRINARLEFSPRETGRLLAAHLVEKKPDLVLMGRQAGYADTGLVPYYAAEALGFPLLADIENVTSEMLRGLPLAVSIGNSPITALRASTLRQQIEAGKKQPAVIPADASPMTTPVLIRNRPKRSIQMAKANALPGILRGLLSGASEAAKPEAKLTPPDNVRLFDHTRADAAIRYAIENNLPCVNGVIGLSDDGKYVITKACSSHLEWRIPITHEEQVWVPSPALSPTQQAKLLLVGGRGMGKEGIAKLQALASLLAGAFGLTRAAAQNGWGGMDRVIGQSGIVARPEVCVAFGASGAAAFMAGVEKARALVAVNTDPDAPIFHYADYGVIEDAETAAGVLLEAFA